MTLLDPILLQSGINRYRPAGFADKIKKINTSYFWFNFIIPLIIILMIAWFVSIRHKEKKKLYEEYVPPHLNHFIDDSSY